jgi:hypothetical protein
MASAKCCSAAHKGGLAPHLMMEVIHNHHRIDIKIIYRCIPAADAAELDASHG